MKMTVWVTLVALDEEAKNERVFAAYKDYDYRTFPAAVGSQFRFKECEDLKFIVKHVQWYESNGMVLSGQCWFKCVVLDTSAFDKAVVGLKRTCWTGEVEASSKNPKCVEEAIGYLERLES